MSVRCRRRLAWSTRHEAAFVTAPAVQFAAHGLYRNIMDDRARQQQRRMRHTRQKSPAEIQYCCFGLRSRWDSICLLVWHDDLFTSVVFVCPVVAKTDRTHSTAYQHMLGRHDAGLHVIMGARAERCLTCHQVQRVERRRGHQVHRGIHRNNRGRTSPMATVAVYV